MERGETEREWVRNANEGKEKKRGKGREKIRVRREEKLKRKNRR